MEPIEAIMRFIDSDPVVNIFAFIRGKRQITVLAVCAVVCEIAIFTIHENSWPTRNFLLKVCELFEEWTTEIIVAPINCCVKFIIPPFILVDYPKRTFFRVQRYNFLARHEAFIVIKLLFITKNEPATLSTFRAVLR